MENEVINKALESFGFEHQSLKCIEECAELIDAIVKFRQFRISEQDVITELADVSIMVEQMAIYFGMRAFLEERDRKILSLQKRMRNERLH